MIPQMQRSRRYFVFESLTSSVFLICALPRQYTICISIVVIVVMAAQKKGKRCTTKDVKTCENRYLSRKK